jgi:eukaryotic-like serine/threonine-protein kinase
VARVSDDLVLVQERGEESLARFLRRRGRIPADEAVPILRDITAGLVELHQASVIHRDIKPANILYHESAWKLADFGIARDADLGTGSQTWMGIGSRAYMAPETWRGTSPTAKTDLYSLGCIGFELIAGSRPFAGPDDRDYERQHLSEAAPSPPTDNSRLARLIERLLMKDQGRRPQDARDVAETLERMETPRRTNKRLASAYAAAVAHKRDDDRALSAAIQEEARRDSFLRQSSQDLEDVPAEAADYIRDEVSDARFAWEGLPEIRSSYGSLMFRSLQPYDSGERDDPTIAYGEVQAKYGNGATSVIADIVYEEVEKNRCAWTVYGFRKAAIVPDENYAFGPGDREHGLDAGRFGMERRNMRRGGTDAYTSRTYPLTVEAVADLFAEVLGSVG